MVPDENLPTPINPPSTGEISRLTTVCNCAVINAPMKSESDPFCGVVMCAAFPCMTMWNLSQLAISGPVLMPYVPTFIPEAKWIPKVLSTSSRIPASIISRAPLPISSAA